MDIVRIKRSLYEQLQEILQYETFENGGILGEKNGIICFFCIDHPENFYTYKYEPNISYLNKQIKNWKEKGIVFCGMIHSHPPNCNKLSYADKMYAERIMESNIELKQLYFGITCMIEDHSELIIYVVHHNKTSPQKVQIHLVED